MRLFADMGKRRRSDDDENCGGQLQKNHISEKEVNMGVLQERNMAEVYNKTMAMLFRGTKNLANNNACVDTEMEAQEAEEPQSRDKVAYRQLSLSNSCQIVKQKKEPLIWRGNLLFYP